MMYSLGDLWDKTKRYSKFTKDEWIGIFITVLVFGFIISFKEWGPGDQFDLTYGLKNLFSAILISFVIVVLHHMAQRIAGLSCGMRGEHKIWWVGIGLGIVLAIVSRGNIWFLAASGVYFHHLQMHRLGYWRYGIGMKGVGGSTFAGPCAVIILVTFIKSLELYVPFIPLNPLMVQKMFIIGWGFALWNLIPIPPLDGSRIMFSSRLAYAFLFGFIAGYFVLVYAFGIYSYIWALVFGGIAWLVFYIVFETKVIN